MKKRKEAISHREAMRREMLKRVQREIDKAMVRPAAGEGGNHDKAEAER